jgi:hypothetical protein
VGLLAALARSQHELSRAFHADRLVAAEGVFDADGVGGERDAERECVLEG